MAETDNQNAAYTESVSDVFERWMTSRQGLSSQEVEARLAREGPNVLEKSEKTAWWRVFLRQFQDFFLYVLFVAAGISFLFQHVTDGVVILALVGVNALLGFIQEYKAERAVARLQDEVDETVTVYRDGTSEKVTAETLVPGDIIAIREGARIPADARLFEDTSLRITEASLTGESVPVDKQTEVLPEGTDMGDRTNMVFMGTFCTAGHGRAVVVRTGMDTVLGGIVTDLSEVETRETHFQRRLGTLARTLAGLAFGLALLLGILSVLWGTGVADASYVAIVSLVGSIPEGLPAVLVVVLALGAQRMAKRNVIIRNLSATETLGSTSTIVTDKTGTLTQNTMTVEHVLLPDRPAVNVTGQGWKPEGEFRVEGKTVVPFEYHHLSTILHISAMATGARVYWEKEKETYAITGDPTEAALVTLAEKAGLSGHVARNNEERLDDLTFSSERKFRASLVRHRETGRRQVYVIGAPEIILERSTHVLTDEHPEELSSEQRDNLHKRIEPYVERSVRMIAIALKDVPEAQHGVEEDDVADLTFVGFVGMIDPPRPQVARSLRDAQKAGMTVVMATGDHQKTAESVAKEVGLLEEEDGDERVVTQTELEPLSDEALQDMVGGVRVCARLSPHMKLRVAKALQKNGEVVAMTGDGVNDAPALKQADVGIAMGITGTDVAREASQIVLTDDNFRSIVGAIEEGRVVFRNVRQTSSYLVSSNIAEDIVLLLAVGTGFGLPLLPAQLLWLNLATSGITDIALATEPSHGDVLQQSPQNVNQPLLSSSVWSYIGVVSVVMALPAIAAFMLITNPQLARTTAFAMLATTQIVNVFNFRSLYSSLGQIKPFSNRYVTAGAAVSALATAGVLLIPGLQGMLQFQSLPPELWLLSVAAALPVLFVGEGYKWMRSRT
jgi:Ca2+-transporting ATPase